MNPQLLFGVQFTLSLIIFVMVSRWYISPALGRMPIRAALVPLFLIHALRYLPSSAFAPGQVDPKIPMDTMASIAFGDLISALLAIIAVVFLNYEWQGAIAVAWVVNALTSLDWLYGGYLAASSKILTIGKVCETNGGCPCREGIYFSQKTSRRTFNHADL
jgi:hypothetical protein